MMHGYKFKNYHIEIYDNTGVLYKDNWLKFKGERRDAMTEFVIACNDKTIYNKFKGQTNVDNLGRTSNRSIGQVHRGQGSESEASPRHSNDGRKARAANSSITNRSKQSRSS
tara:strand:+ start:334 stop:669 length:336 start_codon:yes stop_codon:yes gene_type:complete